MLEAHTEIIKKKRRDTGEGYETFVKGLAEASGVPTPTREELVRFDRKRKKRTNSRERMNPHDPYAKITRLKDGPVWGTRWKKRWTWRLERWWP